MQVLAHEPRLGRIRDVVAAQAVLVRDLQASCAALDGQRDREWPSADLQVDLVMQQHLPDQQLKVEAGTTLTRRFVTQAPY